MIKLCRKLLFLWVVLYCNSLYCQDSAFISSFKFSLSKGVKETRIQTNNQRQELDFLNYNYLFPILLEDAYTGIGLGMVLPNHIEINFHTLMQYKANFKNYKINMCYFPKQYIGFQAGISQYEQIFSEFYDFPFLENDGTYFLIADKKTRLRVKDRTFYAGMLVRKTQSRFQVDGSFNIGIYSFNPFDVSLLLKQQNSNVKKKVEFQSDRQIQVFVKPELSLSYLIFKGKHMDMGMEFNSNAMLSGRSIQYTKTVYTQTMEQFTATQIHPESHLYFRYEIGLGLFVQW